MDILIVLSALLIIFVLSAWWSARSYSARGRLYGMKEATQEVIRGAVSHYENDSPPLPSGLAKAVEALNAPDDHVSYQKLINRYHAKLWVFGDALGGVCWQKGYRTAKRNMAPREDRILVELSRSELLHVAWLAHLGFKHMMPNYRGFEVHRFDGRVDAQDGSFAVEKLEVAIPAEHRPFDDPLVQSKDRLKLIQNWWPSEQLQTA